MTDTEDTRRLQHYIELIESELHQSQRRQQSLISALDRARAELAAPLFSKRARELSNDVETLPVHHRWGTRLRSTI